MTSARELADAETIGAMVFHDDVRAAATVLDMVVLRRELIRRGIIDRSVTDNVLTRAYKLLRFDVRTGYYRVIVPEEATDAA